MNENELLEILHSSQHETDTYDFKERWENTNSELLKDILSFANTAHHHDCYLIYGINDGKDVIGITDTDKNRKNQQNISDFLQSLNFANSSIPKVLVNTLELENKLVDILTIKDSDQVPFYLRADYTKDGLALKHGEIFFRDEDSNFGKQQAPTYETIENLWKKHFHLDLTPIEQFKFALKDIINWTYHEGDNEAPKMCVYNSNLDFHIEISFDPSSSPTIEAFSVYQARVGVMWGTVRLKYKNILIYKFNCISLNQYICYEIDPKRSLLNESDLNSLYFYLYANSIEKLTSTVINYAMDYKTHVSPNESDYNFKKKIVVYSDEEERKRIEKDLKAKFSTKKALIPIYEADVNELKQKMRLVEGHSNTDAQELIKEANIARYINENYLHINYYFGDHPFFPRY